MLRLVSQFDNEKARVSVATPTCCCCCCCCIVTTLTSSIFTSMSLGKVAAKQQPSSEQQSSKMLRVVRYSVYGFLLLPIVLGVAFLINLLQDTLFIYNNYVFIVPILIWVGGLYLFHRKYGLSWVKMCLIFFLTPIALVVEFFIWGHFLLSDL